ncbi:MAG TPA: hypothetical protein PLN93_08555 [Vicinamibacterales bacterium]|nr:hypothetical protein [Vicinamibacterales bacterium]HPK71976.1 hypothetical protein [Vicinamibacterales bacterium]
MAVVRSLLLRAVRVLLSVMYLLGSRTVVAAGLTLAVWTGAGAARNLWFAFSGTAVEGIVVRQIEEYSADWNETQRVPADARAAGIDLAAAQRRCRAVVQFRQSGRIFEVVSSLADASPRYPLHSTVVAVYPPGRPERARLRPELPDGWVQAGLLFAATMLGAGSVRLWWALARRRAGRRRVVTPVG